MSPDPVWPWHAAEIVLWAELVAIWTIASYAIAPDIQENHKKEEGRPFRSAATAFGAGLVGAAGWLLPPEGSSSFVRYALTGLLVASMLLNTEVRHKLVATSRRRYLAEWEIGINVGVAITSAALIGLSQIGSLPENTFIRSGKVASAMCILASFAFVFRGGTYIVRSALDKANAVPAMPVDKSEKSEPAPNLRELNRGRAIGNLERLVMVIVIGLGSYEALGFLVAAKGLIRAREFEDRDFAEYFILGSLASVAVALVGGTLLRISLSYLSSIP